MRFLKGTLPSTASMGAKSINEGRVQDEQQHEAGESIAVKWTLEGCAAVMS